MSNNLYGLLSGKYDSTKQRAVLLNGDRRCNFKSYTATMRMELLLTGQIILTDAQFFDGLYFHWLADDSDEFDAFKKLMVSFRRSFNGEKPLFSIAIKNRYPKEGAGNWPQDGRVDLDWIATKMYCKPFQFSSIEEDGLAQAVFELSQDYGIQNPSGSVENKIHEAETTLDGYIDAMQTRFSMLYNKDSSLAKNWEKYSRKLRTMYSIQNEANAGGFLNNNKWVFYDFKDGMDKCLSQKMLCDKQGNVVSYGDHMNHLLENLENIDGLKNHPIAQRCVSRAKEELGRNIINRSRITTALDELERLEECIPDDRQKKMFSDCLTDVRQLMNDRYNKTQAYQHGSRFLDLCEYRNIFKQIEGYPIISHSISFNKDLLKNLAEPSWKDFVEKIECHRSELESSFSAWMSSYMTYPQSSTMDDLKKNLKIHLEIIDSLLSVPDGYMHPEQPTPWDQSGTCSKEVRELLADAYPYHFIGGGSYKASSDGNELCILCGSEEDMDKIQSLEILQLQMDSPEKNDKENESDISFDTLLAPVSNPLNGGELKNVKEYGD